VKPYCTRAIDAWPTQLAGGRSKLLDALREYWRWMKPVNYVFPGVVDGCRMDAPASDKIVWHACRVAAQRDRRSSSPGASS
jgi:hypothetical protein